MGGILLLPIIEITLVGALSGLVGALAVLRKRVFYTASLTHATFPGAVAGVVVVSTFLGKEAGMVNLSLGVFIGAALMCLPMMALMGLIPRVPGQSEQAAAGIVLTFGFGLGYFLSKWFAPLPLKVSSFLTGSVLTVNMTDIISTLVVLVVTILVVIFAGKELLFCAFDPIGFRASGYRLGSADTVILVLITATVVVVMPAIGSILSIALIAAPAAGLVRVLSSTWSVLIGSSILGVVSALSGLYLAIQFNYSVGGTITLTAAFSYLVCVQLSPLCNRVRRKHHQVAAG